MTGSDVKWFMFMLIAFILAMCAWLVVSEINDGKIAQACVSSGGEWLQKRGDQYECRR